MGLKNNWMVMVTGLLSCLLASVILLNFSSVFSGDWNNHLWLIEYFGESIKHWCFPLMVNTKQLVGMPFTLFYGQKFYALAGVLSAFLGSAVTVRIMVFMVFLLQFFQVYRAAMKAGATGKISICIAVMMTWAIYPLTNLYNRSALPEFFAVVFLTCSLASFLCVVIHDKAKAPSKYDIIATGLFFSAAAMTHSLTALFGGLFLFILGLTALIFCERARRLWLLTYFSITAFFSGLVLSPWIYLLHQFKDKLLIAKSSFLEIEDPNILSILSPFPFDFRSLQKGVEYVSTPYLDTQVVLPLLILIGAFIYIALRDRSVKFCLSACQQALIWACVGMLIVALTMLVYPAASGWFGGFFKTLQYAYRLTSYVNLSILVVVIILAGRVSSANVHSQQVINICLAFCIGISLSALILKLVHASAIAQPATAADKALWAPLPFGSNRHLNDLPESFYGTTDYSIADGMAKDTVSGVVPVAFRYFHVLDGTRFGHLEDLTVNLTQPTLVITNVQAFPWNQIFINGSLQPWSHTVLVNRQEAVLLLPGSYLLKTVTHIDGMWQFLNFVSWILLLAWMALWGRYVFKK